MYQMDEAWQVFIFFLNHFVMDLLAFSRFFNIKAVMGVKCSMLRIRLVDLDGGLNLTSRPDNESLISDKLDMS